MTITQTNNVDLITQMYMEMLEDEDSDLRFSFPDAKKRIAKYMADEPANIIENSDQTLGYALVKTNMQPIYLHHFYICRDARRQKNGTKAFQLLLQTLGADEMDLDVYVWNERGNAFWQSLGFKPRATIMRYSAGKPT